MEQCSIIDFIILSALPLVNKFSQVCRFFRNPAKNLPKISFILTRDQILDASRLFSPGTAALCGGAGIVPGVRQVEYRRKEPLLGSFHTILLTANRLCLFFRKTTAAENGCSLPLLSLFRF